jgi:hypothetical protein
MTSGHTSGTYAVDMHDELMSLTLRLVGEYPQFPRDQ